MPRFEYLAAFENAPAPFVYTPSIHQRQIRGGVFALLTDNLHAFEASFGHLFDRIAGVIITFGEVLEIRPRGSLLWHVTLPNQHQLLPITTSYLQLIAAHRSDHKENKKLKLELDHYAADIEYWSNYSELIQGKLRSDLRQYTEWTVKALTELLKFSANKLQSADIEHFPELIVHFLRHDVFDDGAVAMLCPSELPLINWEILAQTSNFPQENGCAHLQWQPDVWQLGNDLFVPFTVHDNKYIIVLCSSRPKNAYSDYELTFYRLFSTLLEAIYVSKLNEQALNQALKTKDDFLANMSHELRTPLNAIMGRAEAMQAGIYGSVSAKQGKALKTIEQSGRHLLALINDVLTFAKMEAEALTLEKSSVDLQAICEESLNLVRDQATQKQIKVIFTLDHDVTIIQADERRLKQILLNLLSNAVKFTPAGGKVGLTVMGDETDGIVRLTVWDKGIGIAEEDLQQLFKPFVQIDSRLSREYEGTGLGLALVERLTRLHGGEINVTSQPHRGSQFTVSLPWVPSKPEPIQPPLEPLEAPQLLKPTTSPLILLAEDNAMNREMLVEFLEFMDYRVLAAADGQEAVEMARRHCPDLILMDVQMPKLDGLEATRILRADPTTKHLTIVALTGLAMSGDRERCLSAEVDDYLTKPVSLKLLQEAIEKHTQPLLQPAH